MTPEEAAWLAGYIDGDGCVSLSNRSGRVWRSPLLVIDSCDTELLDEVIRLAGGALIKKPSREAHHRQAWTWRLTGADNIIALLTKIEPYMRCRSKRDRAKMLINRWRECTPSNGFYSDDQRQRKADFEAQFLACGGGRGSRTRWVNLSGTGIAC